MRASDFEKGISVEMARGLLRYDRETGKLFWKHDRNQNILAGSEAGSLDKKTGYLRITIHGHRVMAYRLIWLIETGLWPKNRIDHENLIRSDNRWDNLREANDSQNKSNQRVARNNLLGVKGVRLHETGKYMARITKGRITHYLGLFDTVEAASAAYKTAAASRHGEFARTQ